MTTESFRAKALAWLQAHAQSVEEGGPADFENDSLPLAESKAFQKALWEAGLAGITWPREYGGQGLGPQELIAFNEVAADFRLPTSPLIIGLGMPGPTILELGTEQQKRRYLPPLLKGEEIWCQLFSEPVGGSDLASLRMTAVRSEAGWVLNGQKVWTSGAQHSDFGAILARTDPTVPRHQGITMFIVDMHHPGITVRPLVVANGAAPFNEVYFDDVEIPVDAVIGEVNEGWQAAVVMLRNERVALGTGLHTRANPLGYDTLHSLVRSRGRSNDVTARQSLAQVYAREHALTTLGRVLHEETTAGVEIGARGSVAKLAGAEQAILASDVALELFGDELALGSPDLDVVVDGVIAVPGHAIAGGTLQIQRNIIAERILGLPKDAGIDRDVPFNQIRFGPTA